MKYTLIIFVGLFYTITGFSYSHFSTKDPVEIRKLLKHHRDLLDEYLIYGVENPGVRISEARVRYITVLGESGGDKFYNCELNTELRLSDNTHFSAQSKSKKSASTFFNSLFRFPPGAI